MAQHKIPRSVKVGTAAGLTYVGARTQVTHFSGRRGNQPRKGFSTDLKLRHIGEGFAVGAGAGVGYHLYEQHEKKRLRERRGKKSL